MHLQYHKLLNAKPNQVVKFSCPLYITLLVGCNVQEMHWACADLQQTVESQRQKIEEVERLSSQRGMMDLELADFESTTASLRAQFDEQTRQLNERSQVLVLYCAVLYYLLLIVFDQTHVHVWSRP